MTGNKKKKMIHLWKYIIELETRKRKWFLVESDELKWKQEKENDSISKISNWSGNKKMIPLLKYIIEVETRKRKDHYRNDLIHIGKEKWGVYILLSYFNEL